MSLHKWCVPLQKIGGFGIGKEVDKILCFNYPSLLTTYDNGDNGDFSNTADNTSDNSSDYYSETGGGGGGGGGKDENEFDTAEAVTVQDHVDSTNKRGEETDENDNEETHVEDSENNDNVEDGIQDTRPEHERPERDSNEDDNEIGAVARYEYLHNSVAVGIVEVYKDSKLGLLVHDKPLSDVEVKVQVVAK